MTAKHEVQDPEFPATFEPIVVGDRAWVLTRRINHSAHHRGQLGVYLRLLDLPVPSVYGPTADTGDQVIYAFTEPQEKLS